MRSAGASYRVTKNRLVRRALEGTPFAALAPLFTGPTAIAFSRDPVAAAKAAVEYANRNTKLTIVGGGLSGQMLDQAGVKALATLPSLDELRGKIIGLINAPATKLAGAVANAWRPARAGARAPTLRKAGPGRTRPPSRAEGIHAKQAVTAQSGVATWLNWQGSSTICRR